MSRFILLFMFVGILSCSTATTTRLHDLPDASKQEVATVVDSCDDSCKEAIYEDGGFDGSDGNSFFGTGTRIGSITVQSVNGIEGSTSITSDCGGSGFYNVLNNYWDWSFILEVSPGKSTFKTYSSNCNIKDRTPNNFEVNLEAGHKYALALVSRNVEGAGYYDNEAIEWYPVMYDYNESRLVINHDFSGWLRP